MRGSVTRRVPSFSPLEKREREGEGKKTGTRRDHSSILLKNLTPTISREDRESIFVPRDSLHTSGKIFTFVGSKGGPPIVSCRELEHSQASALFFFPRFIETRVRRVCVIRSMKVCKREGGGGKKNVRESSGSFYSLRASRSVRARPCILFDDRAANGTRTKFG